MEGAPPVRRDGADVLHDGTVSDVGAGVTAIAEAMLEAALASFESSLPFAIIALGRFGGAELSYASDLDVVFVYEGAATSEYEEAMRLAMGMRRFVAGPTPTDRIWNIDLDLRPEGKQGRSPGRSTPSPRTSTGGRMSGSGRRCSGPTGRRRRRRGAALHGPAREVRVGAGTVGGGRP